MSFLGFLKKTGSGSPSTEHSPDPKKQVGQTPGKTTDDEGDVALLDLTNSKRDSERRLVRFLVWLLGSDSDRNATSIKHSHRAEYDEANWKHEQIVHWDSTQGQDQDVSPRGRKHSISNTIKSLYQRSRSLSRSRSPKRLSLHASLLQPTEKEEQLPENISNTMSTEKPGSGLSRLSPTRILHRIRSRRFDEVEPPKEMRSSPIPIPKPTPPSLPPLRIPPRGLMILEQETLTGRPPRTPVKGQSPMFASERVTTDEEQYDDFTEAEMEQHIAESCPDDNPFDDDILVTQELEEACKKSHGCQKNSQASQNIITDLEAEDFAQVYQSPRPTPCSTSTHVVFGSEGLHNQSTANLALTEVEQTSHDYRTDSAASSLVSNISQSRVTAEVTISDSKEGSTEKSAREETQSMLTRALRTEQSGDLVAERSLFKLPAVSRVVDIGSPTRLLHIDDQDSLQPSTTKHEEDSLSKRNATQHSQTDSSIRIGSLRLRKRASTSASTSATEARRQLRFSNVAGKALNTYLHENENMSGGQDYILQHGGVLKAMSKCDSISSSAAQSSPHSSQSLSPTKADTSQNTRVARKPLPPGDRFLDQHSWSPFSDEGFAAAALLSIEQSKEDFKILVSSPGGLYQFWQEARLSPNTAPQPDTQALSTENADLLVHYVRTWMLRSSPRGSAPKNDGDTTVSRAAVAFFGRPDNAHSQGYFAPFHDIGPFTGSTTGNDQIIQGEYNGSTNYPSSTDIAHDNESPFDHDDSATPSERSIHDSEHHESASLVESTIESQAGSSVVSLVIRSARPAQSSASNTSLSENSHTDFET